MLGYQLHPTSHIGLAWIAPKRLILEEGATIGHLTVCKGLDELHLEHHSTIGRLNWITGYPSTGVEYFADDLGRRPQLVLGQHASITHRHLLDCTAAVTFGEFSTMAGWRSQLLTHSIDLATSRQTAAPIEVGRYCFVGTDCVILGGSRLPDMSVLGAKSLLNKAYSKQFCLYGGTPARPIRSLDRAMAYFLRETGAVR